jgi:pyruvate/2-oxoglutarate dehydrogenase complex dihydrolipoamide dehydrogenase (E3) component
MASSTRPSASNRKRTTSRPTTDPQDGRARVSDIDYKTNLPGIYAIGDVIGPPWLAHVASEEAVLCVERIAWRDKKLPQGNHEPIAIDYSTIPGCTYCHPQVASVGFTERALKAMGKVKGKDYAVGTFPFSALGKAIATRHTDGFARSSAASPAARSWAPTSWATRPPNSSPN